MSRAKNAICWLQTPRESDFACEQMRRFSLFHDKPSAHARARADQLADNPRAFQSALVVEVNERVTAALVDAHARVYVSCERARACRLKNASVRRRHAQLLRRRLQPLRRMFARHSR